MALSHPEPIDGFAAPVSGGGLPARFSYELGHQFESDCPEHPSSNDFSIPDLAVGISLGYRVDREADQAWLLSTGAIPKAARAARRGAASRAFSAGSNRDPFGVPSFRH